MYVANIYSEDWVVKKLFITIFSLIIGDITLISCGVFFCVLVWVKSPGMFFFFYSESID